MKHMKSIFGVILSLVLSLSLVACGQGVTAPSGETALAEGGVLYLKVNPEIAVAYDTDGNVTSVNSRNADASALLEGYTGFEGKSTREVVSELVTLIGDAGYFVEEIEGEKRQITIEIESGSVLPSETFLDEVVADVKLCISTNDWSNPIALEGTTIYGMSDYVDTDYGPNNDGVTDFGPTDYNDTDYGPNNDGVTDYDDTDYGPNNDGVTDYDKASDYGNSGYDKSSDYGDSDYDD